MNDVDLMAGLFDAFLEIAEKIPLVVYLGGLGQTYTPALPPARIIVSLRISKLSICIYNNIEMDCFPFLFLLRASATTLTVLDMLFYRDELIRFEGIILPSLRKLFLHLSDRCLRKKVTGFIAAQRGITWLFLDGDIDIHPFPPDALPNLRTLCAPTRFLKTLISGRPVGVIYTQRDRRENEPGWPKEEIAQLV